jgi:hypothetical protein
VEPRARQSPLGQRQGHLPAIERTIGHKQQAFARELIDTVSTLNRRDGTADRSQSPSPTAGWVAWLSATVSAAAV